MLNILFPLKCAVCKTNLTKKRRFESVCEKCFTIVEIESGFKCPECFGRLPTLNKTCHPKADFILANAVSFKNNAVRELVCSLKYQNIKCSAEPLKEILGEYIRNNFEEQDLKSRLFIPVPLHKNKKRKRGFNQSELILKLYQSKTKKINISSCLKRTKDTPSQTKCENYEERRKNLDGVFQIKKSEEVKNKNVIIFDDVFTSGATMREAVKVLKKAGARKIIGLVIAKA